MTDFLFARPSVLEGIGRNMDFFGSLNQYNTSHDEIEADRAALLADVEAPRKEFDTAYKLVTNGLKV
jgi:hypothetical protein